jgi:hypothetical protein
MDDAAGALVVFVIGAAIAVFVVWVVLALIMRLLALLVIYWIVTFAVGLLAGLVAGLAVPLRVLRNRARVQPVVVTPEAVVAGKVIALKARGAARNFGWDRAWPVYNPYQARNDARAVIADTVEIMKVAWPQVSPSRWNRTLAPPSGSASGGSKRVARAWTLITSLPGIAWVVVGATPISAFFLGLWLSIAFWLVAMGLFGGAVYVGQQAWVMTYRWLDKLGRKKARASLKCVNCYRETETPSYKCPNPACSIVHRDVSPGPLGVMYRRCECGTRLPTTIRAAAKELKTVCPHCEREAADGSGTRRTIQVPTIGAVSAGKTRLVAAGIATIEDRAAALGGTLGALSTPAGNFQKAARELLGASMPTSKTQLSGNPEGWPYHLKLPKQEIEIHFVDAAGEAFVNMDTTQNLGYIDAAEVILLVIDPLGLPGIYEEAVRAGVTRRLEIATTDQEDAYASAIDRLRAENINLRRRKLGVVVTKMDILRKLEVGQGINVGSSDGIRQWLVEVGQDGLVRRVEDDFADIHYFGTDLMQQRELTDPLHPIKVYQWLLDKSGTKITIAPVATPVPTATEVA